MGGDDDEEVGIEANEREMAEKLMREAEKSKDSGRRKELFRYRQHFFACQENSSQLSFYNY